MKNNFENLIKFHFKEHAFVLQSTSLNLINKLEKASSHLSKVLSNGKKIFWCGNGGSASDSVHLSAELIGRFKKNRIPLKSIALPNDPATMTCISNDFGFEKIFSRQIEGLGEHGDVLITITTSGNSKNILEAIKEAKRKKMKVISFLGKTGGKCKGKADLEFMIKSNSTARIQEMHILLGHILCDLIERKLKL